MRRSCASALQVTWRVPCVVPPGSRNASRWRCSWAASSHKAVRGPVCFFLSNSESRLVQQHGGISASLCLGVSGFSSLLDFVSRDLLGAVVGRTGSELHDRPGSCSCHPGFELADDAGGPPRLLPWGLPSLRVFFLKLLSSNLSAGARNVRRASEHERKIAHGTSCKGPSMVSSN